MQQKNILFCFVDHIEDETEFERLIGKFDEKGFEIHILNGVNENQIQPHHVLSIIETIIQKQSENSRLYFLTNIRDFFLLIYRVYHQTFSQFLYVVDQPVVYSVELDEIYQALFRLDKNVVDQEKLVKPIFINREDQFSYLEDHVVVFSEIDCILRESQLSVNQKFYYLNKSYYLLEPTNGEHQVISLDHKEELPALSFNNTRLYSDSIQLEQTISILGEIQASKDAFFTYYNEIQKHFNTFTETILMAPIYTKKLYIEALDLLSESFNTTIQVYILSFLVNLVPESKYLNKIYSKVIQDPHITKEEKYFILYQCVRIGFIGHDNTNSETAHLNRKLYRAIFNDFKMQLEDRYTFIPKEERNEDLIFVMTGQFLGLNHAPTKTALDRCYSLIKHLGKKVLLINTKELLTTKKIIPFYNITFGNVVEDYQTTNSINYKDIAIPFYQVASSMPNMTEIVNILDTVDKHKPYMIINIGGGSITADLISQLVPTVTISTVFSGLSLTEGQFQVVGRKITPNEIEFLKQFGFSESNVVESLFTFDFKAQELTYTRKHLNLPLDKFLIAVVGARLDHEITDDFLQALIETTKIGTHLVLIGNYETYNHFVSEKKEWAERISYLGFQEDILAVLELCDLYVNPLRVGGGSSAAEAMFKELPVVTFANGDVSVAAGEEFWVFTLNEMKKKIARYVQDKTYYNEMSIKAKNRAKQLLNTDAEFERVIKKVESSDHFF